MISLRESLISAKDWHKLDLGNKYELTEETKKIVHVPLYRIRALKNFKTVDGKTVKKGDLGGLIEKEDNLSQSGRCWIADDAKVYGEAEIYGKAKVDYDVSSGKIDK